MRFWWENHGEVDENSRKIPTKPIENPDSRVFLGDFMGKNVVLLGISSMKKQGFHGISWKYEPNRI